MSGYYTHEYYFYIHPPLGKLIIAGFGKLFDFQPEFSFGQIGEKFPDHTYLSLRFLPSLAGALLPLIIFLLAIELGLSNRGAFLAGTLIALENALLTQSRYILLDPFLLLFGFTGLLFYFKFRHLEVQPLSGGSTSKLLVASIFFGLALSIKWTGLTFLALAGLIELLTLIKTRTMAPIVRLGRLALFFVAVPLAIYFAVFAVHFSLLSQPGPGDAFMTQNFQQKNVLSKFTELNEEMYRANKGLTATHSYGSPWYTWPLMLRPIYYWVDSDISDVAQRKIYLIGNPVIWWASTFSILYLVSGVLYRERSATKYKLQNTSYILLGGWFLNLLPFIGISRVMFLYHYLTALIFAILMLAYLFDSMKKPQTAIIIMIVISAVSFAYFAPLSYSLPLEESSFQNRMWLKSWQ